MRGIFPRTVRAARGFYPRTPRIKNHEDSLTWNTDSWGMRQAGRVLSGTALRYGDVARIGGQREKFLPGSFPDVERADILLNRQHAREKPLARSNGGGLTVSDSPQALSIRAELPSTVDSDETLELVKRGVLRGLSIEFEALRESQENGTRVVTLAKLFAVAVVDSGAYPASTVEARQRRRPYLQAQVPFNKSLQCRCHRGKNCDKVRFLPGSFAESIGGEGPEVLAIAGQYADALASRRRGTLILSEAETGLLVTTTADLAAQSRTTRILARPVFDPELSEFREIGSGRDAYAEYSKVSLRAILLGPTSSDEGWPAAEFGSVRAPRRRSRLWL